MAERGTKDSYGNKFFGTVTESAANTLTFAEIPTQVDTFSKTAWLIHRLEWYMSAGTRLLLAASDDILQLALTSSEKVPDLLLDNPGVIDLCEMGVTVSSSVGFERWMNPIIRDFTNLPGGGILIAPRPLYIAMKGTSLASAATGAVRGTFTVKTLTADEYIEMVDFYRIIA